MSTLKELQLQKAEIEAKIQAKIAEEKQSVIVKIKLEIQEYKITPLDLFTMDALKLPQSVGKGPKGKRHAKWIYTNPSDTSITWNGLGAAPQWVKALRDSGVDLKMHRRPA